MAELENYENNNHQRAADLYMEAVTGFGELNETERRHLGSGRDSRYALAEASVEYAKADQVERSLEVFRQLEAVGQPQRVWVQQLIGMIRGPSTKEGTRALLDFAAEWIEAHPDAEQADKLWYEFGWQYGKLGEKDQAVAAFMKYLELVNPNDPKTSAGAIQFATDYVQKHQDQTRDMGKAKSPDAPPYRVPVQDEK